MARTTLVREFLRGISTTLVDITPQFRRWGEIELVQFINLGQRAIHSYLPHVGTRQDAIKLLPGTRQDLALIQAARIKPGDGSTAADTAGISFVDAPRYMGANGLTPGRILRRIDQYAKDTADADWHSKTATTPREFIADGRVPKVFFVSPGVPTGADVWIDVKWMAEAAAVPPGGPAGAEVYGMAGSSTQLLGIDDQSVDDLRNYVLAMAYMKGGKNELSLSKAQAHTGMFTASINAKATAVTGVNPNLTVLPSAAQVGQMAG